MYDIAVIGNAVVDSLTTTTDALIEKYNLKKGGFHLMPPEKFADLIDDVQVEELQSGGSTANSAWTMAKVGSKVGYIGRVGGDDAGQHFYNDMQNTFISMSSPEAGSETMQVLVLITDDGQRTFATKGTTSPMSAEFVESSNAIKSSPWLLIEGYMMMDQMDVVDAALALARLNGTKVAITLSAMFVVETCYDKLAGEIMQGVDLIIANDDEMNTFVAHASDREKHSVSVDDLIAKVTQTPRVVTHGAEGAEFLQGDKRVFVPCEHSESRPVDTTGGGDAFVAGFLYHYVQGNSVEQGLKLGHKLAHDVVMQLGGRLKTAGPEFLA